MATRKIDRIDWAAYFDSASKRIADGQGATEAEIRVLEPDAGAQVETEWRPLIGITYDHKDNVLEVAVEHHDHLITGPEEIYVEERGEGMPSSMEVVAGQTKHIIALR